MLVYASFSSKESTVLISHSLYTSFNKVDTNNRMLKLNNHRDINLDSGLVSLIIPLEIKQLDFFQSCLALRYEALVMRDEKATAHPELQVACTEWLTFAEHSLENGFYSITNQVKF